VCKPVAWLLDLVWSLGLHRVRCGGLQLQLLARFGSPRPNAGEGLGVRGVLTV